MSINYQEVEVTLELEYGLLSKVLTAPSLERFKEVKLENDRATIAIKRVSDLILWLPLLRSCCIPDPLPECFLYIKVALASYGSIVMETYAHWFIQNEGWLRWAHISVNMVLFRSRATCMCVCVCVCASVCKLFVIHLVT